MKLFLRFMIFPLTTKYYDVIQFAETMNRIVVLVLSRFCVCLRLYIRGNDDRNTMVNE